MLIITTGYWESVFLQCLELQIELEKIKYWDTEKEKLRDMDELFATAIYSQSGEEIYLKSKYADKEQGVYVDVGSYHPYRFSNTYWAYRMGWNGINIEPNVENFRLFEKLRPRDININCGISAVESCMRYYRYEEGAYNTFDENMRMHYAELNIPIKDVVSVKVQRLDNILRENGIRKIDFLDIDVEGAEMDVLESIDYSVDIQTILLEQGEATSLSDVINSKESHFLKEHGYEAVNRYRITTIYEKIKI